MKTNILFALLVLVVCANLGAQDTLNFSRESLHIKPSKVKLINQTGKLDGVLYQLKDSSILFSNEMDFGDSQYRVTEISELYIEDIQAIYSNKGHRTVMGVLIGAGGGFLVGFISGYVYEKNRTSEDDWFDSSPGFTGIGFGIAFSMGGILVGGMIGNGSSRMTIQGSQYQYNSHKERLHKYTIKNE